MCCSLPYMARTTGGQPGINLDSSNQFLLCTCALGCNHCQSLPQTHAESLVTCRFGGKCSLTPRPRFRTFPRQEAMRPARLQGKPPLTPVFGGGLEHRKRQDRDEETGSSRGSRLLQLRAIHIVSLQKLQSPG